MNDTFDLNNIDDIPEKYRISLNSKSTAGVYTPLRWNILKLFNVDGVNELSISQVHVGLIRLHNMDVSRERVSMKLSLMKRSGQLESPQTGIYKLVDSNKGSE